MRIIYYFIFVFFLYNNFPNIQQRELLDKEYVNESSWQARKKYAKKIINLFTNKK